MLIREVVKICKRRKCFILYNRVKKVDGDTIITQQFLGTHGTAYLLPGGASFDESMIRAAFDIEFNDDDITIDTLVIGEDVGEERFADKTPAPEIELERSPLTVNAMGRELFPVYEAEQYAPGNAHNLPEVYFNKMHFVESEMIRPFTKDKDVELKLRDGFIVVKQGLMLLAYLYCAKLDEVEEEQCSRFADGMNNRFGAYAVRVERAKLAEGD